MTIREGKKNQKERKKSNHTYVVEPLIIINFQVIYEESKVPNSAASKKYLSPLSSNNNFAMFELFYLDFFQFFYLKKKKR